MWQTRLADHLFHIIPFQKRGSVTGWMLTRTLKLAFWQIMYLEFHIIIIFYLNSVKMQIKDKTIKFTVYNWAYLQHWHFHVQKTLPTDHMVINILLDFQWLRWHTTWVWVLIYSISYTFPSFKGRLSGQKLFSP